MKGKGEERTEELENQFWCSTAQCGKNRSEYFITYLLYLEREGESSKYKIKRRQLKC